MHLKKYPVSQVKPPLDLFSLCVNAFYNAASEPHPKYVNQVAGNLARVTWK